MIKCAPGVHARLLHQMKRCRDSPTKTALLTVLLETQDQSGRSDKPVGLRSYACLDLLLLTTYHSRGIFYCDALLIVLHFSTDLAFLEVAPWARQSVKRMESHPYRPGPADSVDLLSSPQSFNRSSIGSQCDLWSVGWFIVRSINED